MVLNGREPPRDEPHVFRDEVLIDAVLVGSEDAFPWSGRAGDGGLIFIWRSGLYSQVILGVLCTVRAFAVDAMDAVVVVVRFHLTVDPTPAAVPV